MSHDWMNPHTRPRAGMREMCVSFWRNRDLIGQLIRREVVGRYRGSLAGLAWSFFNPLLMLAVYTFVFGTIFKARWGVAIEDRRAGFAVIIFVGIIIHGLLAECVNKAPALVLANANYVKRVVFPLEVLPWVSTGSALFHAGISFLVLAAAQLTLGYGIPWTVVWLPVVLLPLVLLLMGVGWAVAATGVFVRDIAQVTGVVTSALMFLAPVFYPITAIPEEYRDWLYLNPLTFILEQARTVVISGTSPDWPGLGIYAVTALALAWGGFWWFQRTRKGFADVL